MCGDNDVDDDCINRDHDLTCSTKYEIFFCLGLHILVQYIMDSRRLT